MSKTKKKIPKSPKQSENDSGDWKEEEMVIEGFDASEFEPTEKSDEYCKKEHDKYIKSITEPFDESIFKFEDEDLIELGLPRTSEVFNFFCDPDKINPELWDNIHYELDTLARRLINNPEQFINLIKKKPSLIMNDYVVKYTILKLQQTISLNHPATMPKEKTPKTIKNAIDILKKAKLDLFIPPSRPKTKYPSEMLAYWISSPTLFVKEVSLMRRKVIEEKGPRSSGRNIFDFYCNVYSKLSGKEPSDKIKKYISKHKNAPLHISLVFVADKNKTKVAETIRTWKEKIPPEIRERYLQ